SVMGELRCVDGTVLTVVAVPCHDRAGTPYEITLDLRRGRRPFASVGERCGFRLAQLAASVTAARQDPEQATAWPDPDDRFPDPWRWPSPGRSSEPGARSGGPEATGVWGVPSVPVGVWGVLRENCAAPGRDPAGEAVRAGFRPSEREYFSLRSRDRGDLPGNGEFRCV